MNEPGRTMEPVSKAVLDARAEASVWITQLHGPNRTPDLEAGLRRWLAERPENAAEFEGLSEVWDLVAMPSVSRGAARVERWERPRSRWPQAAAIFLAVGIAAAATYFLISDPSYSTAVGEQRMVRLDDGSRISLNTDTRVEVSYDDSGRRVRLEKGEAYFEVARNPGRSFVVTAGDRTVTALGTSFVVRRDAGQVVVTLVEGRVAVASAAGGSSAILAPGERLALREGQSPTVDTPRIEAATAWRRGEVMLDDTPLHEAVSEMNRYDSTPIVVDDPAIGGLSVSGLYHTGDSLGFAQSVARMYRLRLIERKGQIHLRK